MDTNEFTEKLKSTYDANLKSVVLYGSAAGGDFQKKVSDYNIIIVLENLAPVEIAKSSSLVRKWVKRGNPPPLFFSPEIIKSSSDVFPIEFFDIKERHKIIAGEDYFKDITIDPKNLRHQCEHELRSMLMNLRPRLAMLADKPKGLIRLALESSSSFFAVFRGILRLAGTTPQPGKKEMIEQLAKLSGIDPAIFLEVVDVREGSVVWNKKEAFEKFEQYLTSINAIVRYIDTF